MCLVLTTVVEVVDGIAVGNHQTLITPLVAKDIDKQAIAGAAGFSLKTLIGAHHLAYLGFLHQGLEGWQIGLPQITVSGLYVH